MSDEIAAMIEEGKRLMKEATARSLWVAELDGDYVTVRSGGWRIISIDVGGNPRADRERVFNNLNLAAFAVNSLLALAAAVKEQGQWRHLDTEKPEDGQRCLVNDPEIGTVIYDYSDNLKRFRGCGFKPEECWWMPIPALPAPPAKEGE